MKWCFSGILCAVLAATLMVGCNKDEDEVKKLVNAPAIPTKDPPPEYVVAMVNDIPLTWKEMEDRAMGYMQDDIKQNHLLIPPDRMEEAKTFFRKRSISAFVLKTIILQEANKENIRPTEEDKKVSYKALANALKPRGWSTNDFFNKGPLPPAQMHHEFDDGILVDKYFKVKCGKNVTANNDEVNKFIAEINKTNELKRAFLDSLRKKIVAGQASFEDLAKKISEDPKSRQNNGVIGDIPRGRLNKVLEDAAFTMKIGEISEVIHSRSGFHILRVNAKLPAKPKTDTTPAIPEMVNLSHIYIKHVPISRKRIMNTIMSQKYQQAKKELYKDLRSKSKITCFLYPDMIFH